MRYGPRLVLSAVRGGSGKTTLALGAVAAWRKGGKQVAVFKKGPDYIDAGWLGAASGGLCYNLDPYLMEEERIRKSFGEHSEGADISVIEGNRGLFDGVDGAGTFSTARLAKMLGAPVVLIVDCTKASGTVAAVVLGCKQYDAAVSLRGVILNNVAPGRHEKVVREAIEQNSGLPVVGAVPRLGEGTFPERHMGLTPFQEHPDVDQAISGARTVAERYLDLDALWNIAHAAEPHEFPARGATQVHGHDASLTPVTIGIIQDSAFQFYYPDNLEALEQHGATLTRINALKDPQLPDVDGLYIGGGFPETQAAELASNAGFCRSLKNAAEHGLPIYAECGGLIYLGRSLRIGDKRFPMVSVVPADFVLEKKPQAHGYTVLEASGPNPFFEKGSVLHGHEFHYSRIENAGDLAGMTFEMRRGQGMNGRKDGLVFRNVLATYSHLHALGTPQWAEGFVSRVRQHRAERGLGKQ